MSESSPSPGQPPGRKRGGVLRTVLPLVLFAFALWFLWRTGEGAGWDNLGRRLRQMSPALLLAAFSSNLARYMLWAGRWQVLLRPVIRAPWWGAQRALMASVFFNTVVPGARPFGGLIRARYLSRGAGLPAGPLYGGAVVDQMGYSLVSMGLGLAVLPAAFMPERAGGGRGADGWVAGSAAVVLAAVFLIAWRRREALLERIRRRLPAVADTVQGAFSAARVLLGRPRSWAVMAAGGVLVWSGNVLTFKLAAAALGADVPLSVAAAAFSLGSLAGVASGTPGGAGTTEAAAIIPMVALGVPEDLALASVLLARGIHYVSAVVLGGAAAAAGR